MLKRRGKEKQLWQNIWGLVKMCGGVEVWRCPTLDLCMCVHVCPDSDLSLFCIYMIVNRTFFVLYWKYQCAQSEWSRQTDKYTDCFAIIPKYTKISIHANLRSLSVMHIHSHTHTLAQVKPHTSHTLCRVVFSQGWWCWSDHQGELQCGGRTYEGCCRQSVHLRNEESDVRSKFRTFPAHMWAQAYFTSKCISCVTWKAEVGLVKIAYGWWLVRGGGGFGRRSRSDVFGGRNNVIHGAIIYPTSNTLLVLYLDGNSHRHKVV